MNPYNLYSTNTSTPFMLTNFIRHWEIHVLQISRTWLHLGALWWLFCYIYLSARNFVSVSIDHEVEHIGRLMYKNYLPLTRLVFISSIWIRAFLFATAFTELTKRKDMTETKVEQFLCLLSAEKRCSDWLSYASNTNDVIKKN